jgi:hypothetical protein
MKKLIKDILRGFNMGLQPRLADDGTSGAYKMRGSEKNILAIFKPIDEEAFAPNNPRGHTNFFGSPTFRPGVLSGESCIREVAAYLLDHKHFSKVPRTTFVEVIHNSFKYMPFTGMGMGSDQYMGWMTELIVPAFQKEDSMDDKVTRTPDSQATTSVGTLTKQVSKQAIEEG